MKRIISLSFALLAVYSAITPAATRPAPADYVENQIIVKFRKPVTDTLEMKLAEDVSASGLKLSGSLDKLNKIYRLKEARPLFKNFKKNRQRIKALLTKDRALLTKKEKRILRRLKRARKNATVPALDRIYKIDLDLEEGQSLEDVVAAYNDDPDVEYAELNYIVSINLTPNDPLYPIQWSLNNTGQMYPESGRYNPPPGTPDADIDAPEAWDIYTGDPEIIVAVIDTGVDYTHRDLVGNMWVNTGEIPNNGLDDDGNGYVDDVYGYDFCNYDSDPVDDHAHGTHCSGIIAAEGDNGRDIAGICWNARIMALKFLGSGGSGAGSNAVTAFYYAVENGADVMSNSWGGGDYSQSMENAINYAYSQGVIMVASAGNNDSTNPKYPAYYDHMIAVAATDSDDRKASFSNYGDWVDIAAPGVDVLSLRANGTSMGTVYDDYTTIASGTSMACPHVAGACALMLSFNSEINIEELEEYLLQSADPISSHICASGRLNIHEAMLHLPGPKGNVLLDSDIYSCSSTVRIKLLDTDLAGNTTQQVTISTNGGDFETVLLTQQGSVPGIFDGTISTYSGVPNTEDGILQVSHGQIITAAYNDANDGTGSPATVIDTAQVDCEPPVIFNVDIDPAGPEPTVTFETDEPSTASVLCGPACGGPYTIDGNDLSLVTSHTIKLIGVSPQTEYFFIIEATDIVGNISVDDNTGQCYSFTTTGPTGGDIYVPSQRLTIQEAIDRSWEGGTVHVADGNYTGDGNRDIDFLGKAITVKSENGPENCIIDCQASKTDRHRGFSFINNEDGNSVVNGFTIKNGYGPIEYIGSLKKERRSVGGAIFCQDSSPTIENCMITNNTAELKGSLSPIMGFGGGMCVFNSLSSRGSSTTLTNCTFSNNWADSRGGAIYNWNHSDQTLLNCKFIGNSTKVSGGGLYYEYRCEPTITNCTFENNSADYSGAISIKLGGATISNCILVGNSAKARAGGIGIYSSDSIVSNCIFIGNSAGDCSAAIHNTIGCNTIISNCTFVANSAPIARALGSGPKHSCDVTVTNCILWDGGNEIAILDDSKFTVTYTNIQGGWEGQSNIDINPWFVDPNGADNIAGTTDDNLHLHTGSHCINTGDPCYIPGPNETDLDGNPRISGGRIDMGTYEFEPIGVIYVDTNAPAGGDGRTWDTAVNYLQVALVSAGVGDEILVAEGTYKPDEDTVNPDGSSDREATFQLKNGVAVRGGYAGYGEPDPNDSDIGLYETILSGDLTGGDAHIDEPCDLLDEPTRAENSYQVVTGNGTNASAVLDGFTITGGNANGPRRTPFRNGGGVYNYSGSPTVTNCTLINNSGISAGGGMYSSSAKLSNCIFRGNWAGEQGGGIRCSGDSMIINCMFVGNGTDGGGGAIYSDRNNLTIANCTISDNSAMDKGGGLYCFRVASATISNSVLWNNKASTGQEIYLSGDDIEAQVSYCNIQGGWLGNGNIDIDPCFVEPGNGDYHLLPESLCIDAGDPFYVPGTNETDLDGFARVFGGRIDMGAYEFSYIQARLRVFPQVINRHSKLKRIMAWIHFPRDITKDQIDKDQPVLLYCPDVTEPIEPIRQYVFQHGRGRYKRTYVLAYYDKAELMTAVPGNGPVDLEVIGKLKTSRYFYGSDTVRIIGRRWRRWWRR